MVSRPSAIADTIVLSTHHAATTISLLTSVESGEARDGGLCRADGARAAAKAEDRQQEGLHGAAHRILEARRQSELQPELSEGQDCVRTPQGTGRREGLYANSDGAVPHSRAQAAEACEMSFGMPRVHFAGALSTDIRVLMPLPNSGEVNPFTPDAYRDESGLHVSHIEP